MGRHATSSVLNSNVASSLTQVKDKNISYGYLNQKDKIFRIEGVLLEDVALDTVVDLEVSQPKQRSLRKNFRNFSTYFDLFPARKVTFPLRPMIIIFGIGKCIRYAK